MVGRFFSFLLAREKSVFQPCSKSSMAEYENRKTVKSSDFKRFKTFSTTNDDRGKWGLNDT